MLPTARVAALGPVATIWSIGGWGWGEWEKEKIGKIEKLSIVLMTASSSLGK